MAASWNTKWGPRRVRRDLPTLAEAVAAAACLTDDRQRQAEFAAELMGIPVADALAEIRRHEIDRRPVGMLTATRRDGTGSRTVVVERKASRRVIGPGRPTKVQRAEA